MRVKTEVTVSAVPRIGGHEMLTIELAGQRHTMDHSWYPRAKAGDTVTLHGKVARLAPPSVTAKFDAVAVPVTMPAENLDPA